MQAGLVKRTCPLAPMRAAEDASCQAHVDSAWSWIMHVHACETATCPTARAMALRGRCQTQTWSCRSTAPGSAAGTTRRTRRATSSTTLQGRACRRRPCRCIATSSGGLSRAQPHPPACNRMAARAMQRLATVLSGAGATTQQRSAGQQAMAGLDRHAMKRGNMRGKHIWHGQQGVRDATD